MTSVQAVLCITPLHYLPKYHFSRQNRLLVNTRFAVNRDKPCIKLSSPSPKPQPKTNKVPKRRKEKGIWTRGVHLQFFLSIRSNRKSYSRRFIRSSGTVNIKYDILSTRQSRKHKIKLEAKSYVT